MIKRKPGKSMKINIRLSGAFLFNNFGPEGECMAHFVPFHLLARLTRSIALSLVLLLTPLIWSLDDAHATSRDLCWERLAGIICVEDVTGRCVAGGATKYLPDFRAIYDAYPILLKKTLCSLDAVILERGGASTASFTYDRFSRPTRAMLRIRADLIDKRISLATFLSFKEQLVWNQSANVDVGRRPIVARPDLPLVKVGSRMPRVLDSLYFLVAHELGHALDNFNIFNAAEVRAPFRLVGHYLLEVQGAVYRRYDAVTTPWSAFDVSLTPLSFGTLGWRLSVVDSLLESIPAEGNTLSVREAVCFYECESTLSPQRAGEIYRELAERTNFLSLYSLVNQDEDFAESLAIYVYAKYLGGVILVDSLQGSAFDVTRKLAAPAFATKLRYLDAVFSNPSVRFARPDLQ
jgi:hypothetical protein